MVLNVHLFVVSQPKVPSDFPIWHLEFPAIAQTAADSRCLDHSVCALLQLMQLSLCPFGSRSMANPKSFQNGFNSVSLCCLQLHLLCHPRLHVCIICIQTTFRKTQRVFFFSKVLQSNGIPPAYTILQYSVTFSLHEISIK